MTEEATNLKALPLFYVKTNNVIAILEACTKISSKLQVSAEVFGVECTHSHNLLCQRKKATKV